MDTVERAKIAAKARWEKPEAREAQRQKLKAIHRAAKRAMAKDKVKRK